MSEAEDTLRDLISNRRTAALGTLHRGEPHVSMVPFALLPDGSGLVIHVSRLAAHTADMLASSRVSVLIAAPEDSAATALALPRATIQGDAWQLPAGEAGHGRAAYLSRFPDAEPMFSLGDFSLFVIRPASVRVISGFGAASTLSAEQFSSALRGQ